MNQMRPDDGSSPLRNQTGEGKMDQERDYGYVELVRNGELRFSLHRLPWQSAEEILEPADEMIHHLERSLEQPVPTGRPGGSDPYPVALVLLLDVRASLDREEFEVQATHNQVVLRARTVQAMFHAVYWFLEAALGVRWLWPGESGQVIPRQNEVRLPLGVFRKRPDFDWRAIDVGGACYGAMDISTMLHGVLHLPLSYQREFQIWCRRNRFGGLSVASGHRWAEIAPPEVYGETHPEYFALVKGERDCKPHDGKHGNQPCLSHPEVARLVAEYACARLEARSDLDVISVALNDSGSPCECQDCRTVAEEAGLPRVRNAEGFDSVVAEPGASAASRSATDELFRHLRAVVDRIGERFPDRYLLTHLYSYYRRPPIRHQLPSKVIGQYCVMGSTFWDQDARDAEYGRIREMRRWVPSLGIYEYYSNGARPEVPRLFPRLVAETVGEYYGAGARYFATQPGTGFAVNGLNFFLLGRCLWDIHTDPGAAVEDFCRSGFGPAADAIRGYYDAFSERWGETISGNRALSGVDRYSGFARLYPKEFLVQRQIELDHAERKAAEHPEIVRRVRFLKLGLRYTCLYCDACRASGAVVRAAGASDLRSLDLSALRPGQRSAVSECARAAVSAWDEYWDFVRAHMGQFVFGDFWVNYRPGTFGEADPDLRKLRELGSRTVETLP